MNALIFVMIGITVGWLCGKSIDNQGQGTAGDVVLGTAGALLGGFSFDALGIITYGFWASVGMATLCAVLFLSFGTLLRRLGQAPSGSVKRL